jgi:LPXTG-motif cell wall-anchored protein
MASFGGDDMSDSLMPPSRTGGSKTVFFLIIGGAALMAAAGFLIFRGSANPLPEAPPKSEDQPIAVKTLVAPSPPPSSADSPSKIETDLEKDTSATEPSGPKETQKGGAESFSGTIDTKEVNAYVNDHFGQVRACYERRLKINSLLEGRLDLNIVVSTSGKVSAIGVNSDTVRDAEMLSCVKKTIRTWEFPKPEGGRVVIGKTFSFKKKE